MGGALGLAVISGAAASVTASLTTRDALPQALTSGYDIGMAVSAGFTLVAALVAVAVNRRPTPAPEARPQGEEVRPVSDAAPTHG